MELEKDGKLKFLNVLVTRQTNGTLGHEVYRNPTHTGWYVQADSNHHPKVKLAIMHTLKQGTLRICYTNSIKGELLHLQDTLENNDYSLHSIRKALCDKRRTPHRRNKYLYIGKAFLSYINSVTDRIGRVLNKQGVAATLNPLTR